MHITICTSKATNIVPQYVILLLYCNNGSMNMPQCYVTPTLPALSGIGTMLQGNMI